MANKKIKRLDVYKSVKVEDGEAFKLWWIEIEEDGVVFKLTSHAQLHLSEVGFTIGQKIRTYELGQFNTMREAELDATKRIAKKIRGSSSYLFHLAGDDFHVSINGINTTIESEFLSKYQNLIA